MTNIELQQALMDLISIAQHRKPGQVTHKIEDIKQMVNQHVAEELKKVPCCGHQCCCRVVQKEKGRAGL